MDSDGQLRAVEDAAVCIQKAVDGKALGASVGEAPFLHRFQLYAFRIRHKYNVLFRLASWGIIFITIFQRPSWSYQDTYCSTWRNSNRFPSFSNAYFYIEEVTASYLSLFFLLVLLVAIVLELMYRSSEYLYIHVINLQIYISSHDLRSQHYADVREFSQNCRQLVKNEFRNSGENLSFFVG